uniref:EGF-like domain-containing protein n=1 Tax=Panagrellus redivivus TaxID=6233 RepID=A0A7E4WD32_PANRE
MLRFCLISLFVVLTVAVADNTPKERISIKQTYQKRQLRQAEPTPGPVPVEQPVPATIAIPTNMAEACTSTDCNNRGTCFGTKQSPICLCQLGYAGPRCADTYCDSARDCNGRGLCMGTSTTFSCLCNFGYSGERCLTEATTVPVPTAAPVPAPAAANVPAEVAQPAPQVASAPSSATS